MQNWFLKRESDSSCPRCGCKGDTSLDQLQDSGVMGSRWEGQQWGEGFWPREHQIRGSASGHTCLVELYFAHPSSDKMKHRALFYLWNSVILEDILHSWNKSWARCEALSSDCGAPRNPDGVHVGPLPPLWLCCGLIISVTISRVPIFVFSQRSLCRSKSQQCPWRCGNSHAGITETNFLNS